jgi:hypothetical protein
MCGPKPCDKPDCTWSEAHRARCEARTVMRWPNSERKRYYGMVAEKRGSDAARQLVADVSTEWKRSGGGDRLQRA